MSRGNYKLNSVQFDNLTATSWFQVSENKKKFLIFCDVKNTHLKTTVTS